MIAPGAQWPVAVVFDCDGLLLDSREAWHSAYAAALGRDGESLEEELLASLNGASVSGAAQVLGVDANELRDHLERAAASPAAMPGAEALVRALGPRLRLAVATNGPARVVEQGLAAAGLLGHFDAVVSAEDLEREKPAPDVYLAACKAIGVDPSDAIALEDSPVGVEAARRAGLVVVYVPSDRSQRADADLRAPRLDDPDLLSLLGLARELTAHPDPLVEARRQLENVCREMLDDEAVRHASPNRVLELTSLLHRDLILWRRNQLSAADSDGELQHLT